HGGEIVYWPMLVTFDEGTVLNRHRCRTGHRRLPPRQARGLCSSLRVGDKPLPGPLRPHLRARGRPGVAPAEPSDGLLVDDDPEPRGVAEDEEAVLDRQVQSDPGRRPEVLKLA